MKTFISLLLLVSLSTQFALAQGPDAPVYASDIIEMEAGLSQNPQNDTAAEVANAGDNSSFAAKFRNGLSNTWIALSHPTKKTWIIGGITIVVLTGVIAGSVGLAGYVKNHAPSSFERGMYVSVWSNTIAANQSARYSLALDDSTKMNQIFSFIEKEKIDSLTLYDIPRILDTKGQSEKLFDFITQAKTKGVKEVIAAGSKFYDYDAMAAYQNKYPNQFDGLTTEVEFWTAATDQQSQAFGNYLDILKHMKSLNMKSNGKPVSLSTYIARLNTVPDKSEMDLANAIAPLVDRVVQACYGQTVADSYADCRRRVDNFVQTRSDVEIIPMISAESRAFSGFGGENWFLGDYLRDNSNLTTLESYFHDRYSADHNTPKIHGFYYFEYIYLDYALTS